MRSTQHVTAMPGKTLTFACWSSLIIEVPLGGCFARRAAPSPQPPEGAAQTACLPPQEAGQAGRLPARGVSAGPARRCSLVSRVAMTLAWLWHSTSSRAKYALPTFLQHEGENSNNNSFAFST